MADEERLVADDVGGRLVEMSPRELLAAVRDHQLNVGSLRQEVIDAGFQSVETMRSLVLAIDAAREILAECQRRGNIQFEMADGEGKRYLAAAEVADLAAAAFEFRREIADGTMTGEMFKAMMREINWDSEVLRSATGTAGRVGIVVAGSG